MAETRINLNEEIKVKLTDLEKEISDGMMFSSSKDSVSKLIMSLIKKEENNE